MKKHVLTAIYIATLGIASYAANVMHIKTKDGETIKFDVNDVKEITFEEKTIPVDTTLTSEHEYVDLGLPSGTLWATCNIGASKPEEPGDYFAWGETTFKEMYGWSTYKYAEASFVESNKFWNADALTKYNLGHYPGIKDSLSTLLAEDDAATANWGDDWRMPTPEEFEELINNCKYTWTTINDVLVAKFLAENGNYILLPSTYCRIDLEISDKRETSFYWSSSLHEEYDNLAYCLRLDLFDTAINFGTRCCGATVRAVRTKKSE